MYDYNFPEALTQERLTLLLLSIVIPTDTVVLKNIYNKKKELETEDDHKDYTMIQKYHPEPCIMLRRYAATVEVNISYRKLSYQIRALYPGFIMCDVARDIAVNTRPLTEWNAKRFGSSSSVPVPSGVNVINYIFREPLLDFLEGGPCPQSSEYDKYHRISREKYRFTLIHNQCSNGLMYHIENNNFDEMYNEFREFSDILKDGGEDETWYESIEELNEYKGIRVDIYHDIKYD